jgi:hypothetical protein
MAKINQKHGPIGKYSARKRLKRRYLEEFDRPDPVGLVRGPSTSTPGRICSCCRGFVPGGVDVCPECYGGL